MKDAFFKKCLIDCISVSYPITWYKDYEKLDISGNIKWILKDVSGNKYFLKEKPYYLNNSEFAATFPFYSLLTIKGIRTPIVLATLNGSLSIEVNNRIFILLKWVEGISFSSRDERDLVELGLINASLHIINNEIQGNWESPECRLIHFIDVRPDAIGKMCGLLNSYDPNHLLLNQITNEFKLWLQEKEKVVHWNDLPTSWLHGDLHSFNVIRKPDGETVLLDLDDIHWGYRLSDITWTIAICCFWDWKSMTSPPRLRTSFDQQAARSLLRGYEQASPLTNFERKALPYFLGAMLIKSLICIESLIRNSKGYTSTEVIKLLQKLRDLILNSEGKMDAY